MNCSKVQTLLSAYLDREVSGVEMLAIRDHLRECDCCRSEEQALRTVKSLLSGTPIEEPPAGFEARLCASVQRTVNSTRPVFSSQRQHQVSPLGRFFAPILNRLNPSRPVFAYATVGLSMFAVALGAFYVVPGGRSSSGLSGVSGMTLGSTTAVGSVTPQRKVNSGTDKRFLEALDRDHAYISSSDPLSGPQVALSASYGSR